MHTRTDALHKQILATIEEVGTRPAGLNVAQPAVVKMARLYLALSNALKNGEPPPREWRTALARMLRKADQYLPADRADLRPGLRYAASMFGIPNFPNEKGEDDADLD